MVILGGWVFLMSEVPLHSRITRERVPGIAGLSGHQLSRTAASERRGNTSKGLKEFPLKAKALTALHVPHSLDSGQCSSPSFGGFGPRPQTLQGYLAHKKPCPPKNLQSHMPRAIWWS